MTFTIGLILAFFILFSLKKFLRLLRNRLKLIFRLIIFKIKHHNNFHFCIRSYCMFFFRNSGKYSNLLIYINGDLYNIKLYSSLRKPTIIKVENKNVWKVTTFLFRPFYAPEPINRVYNLKYDLSAEKDYYGNNMWNIPKVLNIYPVLIFLPQPTQFLLENSEMLWGKAMLYDTYLYHFNHFFKYLKEEYTKFDDKLSLNKKEWKNIKMVYRSYHTE